MIRLKGLTIIYDRNRVALGSPDLPEDNPNYYEKIGFSFDKMSLPDFIEIKGKSYGELNRERMAYLKMNIDETALYAKYKDRGTISHGTHKLDDLIPKALDLLNELNEDEAQKVKKDYADVIELGYSDDEQSMSMAVEIENKITELLPEGLRIGWHEGDLANYGIWQAECYERHPDNREVMCELTGFHQFHQSGKMTWPNED